MNSSSVVRERTPKVVSGGSADTAAAISWKSSVPNFANSASIPRMNA